MSDFTMTIDGKAVAGAGTLRRDQPGDRRGRSPRRPSARASSSTTRWSRPQAAFRAWQPRRGARAARRCSTCADALQARGGRAGAAAHAGAGQAARKARSARSSARRVWFQVTAGLADPGRGGAGRRQRARIEVRRRPLGVVAAITPWNFPLLLAVWKIAPALLAGNTVVIKPSPFTPLSTLMLGEILRDVLPPGVLNVVSGGDELGALDHAASGACARSRSPARSRPARRWPPPPRRT